MLVVLICPLHSLPSSRRRLLCEDTPRHHMLSVLALQERASVREELQTAKRVLSQVKEILQSDNCTLQDIRVLLNTYPLNVTL